MSDNQLRTNEQLECHNQAANDQPAQTNGQARVQALVNNQVLGDHPAENAQVVIQARNVVRDFGSGDGVVHALRGISLDIHRGQFTAIMGPSGSGKSTLMHALAGLDTITSGSLCFNGNDITKMNDSKLTKLRRKSIGFVFQSFNLLPMFNAEQNILMPSVLAGQQVDRAWFHTLVEHLGIAHRLGHRPSELSGGQQQRVAIARALVNKPTVIFADEPTGNLDTQSSRQVLQFLRHSVDAYNQTIVMVTHDPVAASFADRAVIIADGQVVCDVANPDVEQMNQLVAQVSGAPSEIISQASPTEFASASAPSAASGINAGLVR